MKKGISMVKVKFRMCVCIKCWTRCRTGEMLRRRMERTGGFISGRKIE